MASQTAETTFDRPTHAEIQSTIATVKRMLVVAGGLAFVGYLLLLFALSQEFWVVAEIFTEDTMKMWLKLGGVGHILLGIFIALVAIVRVLGLMPDRLGVLLE